MKDSNTTTTSHWMQALSVFAITAALSGCASIFVPGIKEPPPANDSDAAPYYIGTGDTISIHVWRNPELSQNIIVRPDGYISMPLMGDLKADGQRPEQLAEQINASLSRVIRSPEVTVLVVDPASAEYLNRVRVTGQVVAPQSVQFRQGMTVLDLVLQSGGLTDFGAGGRAVLRREIKGEYQEYHLNLDEILNHGIMDTNYSLRAGDVISVPKKQLLMGEF